MNFMICRSCQLLNHTIFAQNNAILSQTDEGLIEFKDRQGFPRTCNGRLSPRPVLKSATFTLKSTGPVLKSLGNLILIGK